MAAERHRSVIAKRKECISVFSRVCGWQGTLLPCAELCLQCRNMFLVLPAIPATLWAAALMIFQLLLIFFRK